MHCISSGGSKKITKHRFARAQQASLDVKVDKNPHTTKVFRRFSVDSVHARIRSFSLHTTLFFCCFVVVVSSAAPVNWERQAFMRATGILWHLKDGGRSNWVLKCLTVEPPVSDHPQREYNYSQNLLCGHPVTSIWTPHYYGTNCFVPGERKLNLTRLIR